MLRLAVFIASCGYAGYFPIAPGTVGSAVGLVLYALVRWTGGWMAEAVTILAVIVVGIWAASKTERYFGRSDPGQIVIDEVAGMLITLAMIPVGVVGAVTGFLLFRIFDIIKPWPAGDLERLHGGFGVMADDVMAGIYAHLTMRLIVWIAPAWMLA